MNEITKELENDLSLKDKINFETAQISWKELEVFFAKGNLLCVAKHKDLVTVAEHIANNQEKDIEALILAKEIEFASPEWARNHCQANPDLWAVVVAPYVVCQLS